jgi:glycosyltransferase involved in cell wall biosynthesis
VAHGWTKENNRVHLYNWLDLQLHRRSNCAIAVSPVLFDTLSQARGKHKPTYLISNAVELPPLSELAQRRQRTSQTEVLTIGVFGRLSHEKGHQVLIRAVERIVRDGSPLQVLIVGDGPERGTLESLVQQLNIQEYFRFVGYQANMAEWYNKIQLLVIPSLTEGLPNVLLEAMAAEIPAVATSVGAVPQVITHDENGWLIPAGDPDALAATLMRILQAPELIRKAGENARASLHPRFSPAARAQSFVDIYRSMLRPVQSTRPIPDRA